MSYTSVKISHQGGISKLTYNAPTLRVRNDLMRVWLSDHCWHDVQEDVCGAICSAKEATLPRTCYRDGNLNCDTTETVSWYRPSVSLTRALSIVLLRNFWQYMVGPSLSSLLLNEPMGSAMMYPCKPFPLGLGPSACFILMILKLTLCAILLSPRLFCLQSHPVWRRPWALPWSLNALWKMPQSKGPWIDWLPRYGRFYRCVCTSSYWYLQSNREWSWVLINIILLPAIMYPYRLASLLLLTLDSSI